ncbi:NAD(P)-binding protein [Podospora aff. communis PSN243]|uniref:NAD(P)-binding protein n=1 Tax=Podospora aff. communis PSN243 TaxID=3040156 RepID=A0AAV9G3I3_9PEZI|nr:NAD(P)-binding protein [Podospora aff. communis PSN243]
MDSATPGTIFVTGANGGLGSAIAKVIVGSSELSKLHGIYSVRNVKTASTLKASLGHTDSSHQHDVVALDLSELANVRDVAAKINQQVADGSLAPIRALVLNAAFQEHTTQTFTVDGFDMSFQCNYLSHWLLTLLLLQSLDKERGRIIVISSCGHDAYDRRQAALGIFKEERWKIMFNSTESLAKGTWSSPTEDPTGLGGMRRYCASKQCLVMMLYELQRRLTNDPTLSNICVLGLDPGGMPTTILHRGNFVMSVISAKDVLRAAFDVETLGQRPRAAYLNGAELWESSAESRDEGKQRQLWLDSVKLTGLQLGHTVLLAWD